MLASTLYAQNNTIVLDGTVQDDKNRPISNATIIISSKNDSNAAFQTVSNKEGKFKIKKHIDWLLQHEGIPFGI